MAPDVFGLSAKNILFVSGNGWDVCGAAWFGYTTFWINRAGLPFEELGVAPHGSGGDLCGRAAISCARRRHERMADQPWWLPPPFSPAR